MKMLNAFLGHIVGESGTDVSPKRLNRQRGMTVTPILLGLAIFALAAIAVFGIFRYVNSYYTTYIENTNLMSIVSGAKSLKMGGSFADVDNAALQRIQAFGSMSGGSAGGTVRNGWGGTVVVTGNASELSIAYNDVPTSACDAFRARAVNSGEFAQVTPNVCATGANTSFTFTVY